MFTLYKKLGLTALIMGIIIVSHTIQAQSIKKTAHTLTINSSNLITNDDTLFNFFVRNLCDVSYITNKYQWSTKANLFEANKYIALEQPFNPNQWNSKQKIDYKPSPKGLNIPLVLNNEFSGNSLLSFNDNGKNIRIEKDNEVIFLNKQSGVKNIKSKMEIVNEASGQKVLVLQSRILLGNNEEVEPQSKSISAQNQSLKFDYFKFYPNPSANNINIQFRLASQGDVKVNIMNLLGQSVYTDELSNFSGEYKQSVNLKEYGTGAYFLQIVQGNRAINRKIIVA